MMRSQSVVVLLGLLLAAIPISVGDWYSRSVRRQEVDQVIVTVPRHVEERDSIATTTSKESDRDDKSSRLDKLDRKTPVKRSSHVIPDSQNRIPTHGVSNSEEGVLVSQKRAEAL